MSSDAKGTLFLPALRCHMGDRYYYATAMKLRDIAARVHPPDEVHERERLSRWIQRQVVEGHAPDIGEYLKHQPQRFFSALVVAVYGGKPKWTEVALRSAEVGLDDEFPSDDRESLEGDIGVLRLRGYERLFAVDGQHRVEGIKLALAERPEIGDEEVCALFVGHADTPEGEERTRRLFTTLNKTAKRVAEKQIIALDEDDGFAVATRNVVDRFDLLSSGPEVGPCAGDRERNAVKKRVGFIALKDTGGLSRKDACAVTTIVTLYHLCQDLYPVAQASCPEARQLRAVDIKNRRPTDEVLDAIYESVCAFWTSCSESIEEFREVLDGKEMPVELRTNDRNHLLFRPIGQRALAKAVAVLVRRNGHTVSTAVETLTAQDLWLHSAEWQEILWDPIQEKMKMSMGLAESFLLHRAGFDARTNASQKKLDGVLARAAEARPDGA